MLPLAEESNHLKEFELIQNLQGVHCVKNILDLSSEISADLKIMKKLS